MRQSKREIEGLKKVKKFVRILAFYFAIKFSNFQ